MKKRGSHVGVVLSFVIFVTFLIFIYTLLGPSVKTQRDKESLLDYLKIELMEKFSTNLTSVTVSVDRTHAFQCVKLLNFTEEAGVNSRLIIKDDEGGTTRVNISLSDESDLLIDRESIQKSFFKAYNSEEFDELNKTTITPCTELVKDATWYGTPSGYSINLIITDVYVFEKRVLELIDNYENDYDELKSELNIPAGTDFGFGLTYNNGTIIGTGNKSLSTSIYVRKIPMQYVSNEAEINLGYLDIQVW